MYLIILMLNLLMFGDACWADSQITQAANKAIVSVRQNLKLTPEQLNQPVPILSQDVPLDYTDKDDVRIFIYNPVFADRFGLDPKKAEPLDKGLYAIELVIKKTKFFYSGTVEDYFNVNSMTPAKYKIVTESIPALEILFAHNKKLLPVSFHYDCYLNLYVDSSLPIFYPQNGVVSDLINSWRVLDRAVYPILKNQVSMRKDVKSPDEDRENFQESFQYKSFLSSFSFNGHEKPLQDRFSGNPVDYANYYRNFEYGISYISLGPILGCDYLAKQNHPLLKQNTAILIENTSGKNYQLKNEGYSYRDDMDLNDFVLLKYQNLLCNLKRLKMP